MNWHPLTLFAATEAIAQRFDGGKLVFTNADGDQVASCPLGNPAFHRTNDGLQSNAIQADLKTGASGPITQCIAYAADGSVIGETTNVGESDAEVVVNNLSPSPGSLFEVKSVMLVPGAANG